MGGETDYAEHLFSAYFHQDCLLDDPDWESVVLRFKESEPFDVVRTTQTELQILLARSDDADLEKFLFGPALLCFYDPRPEGLPLTAWLQEIVHLLAGGAPRSTDRLAISLARREAASIARRVLEDEFDPILATRQLGRLRRSVAVDNDDPDFTTFLVIDSETDALPVDSDRHQWSPEALSRLAIEVVDARSWALTQGRHAFESILRRFGAAG